jgi:hydrophobe/amphiphile efflux-1 (HAE1) family protein
MNISSPFIRRPIATALLTLALCVAGGAAYTQLPVAPLPRVDFPTLSVTASLPGASPETMASAVATPLERRFGRIAGLAEMTSTSTLGQTSITLQFDLDRDVDSAARDVQAAINAAGGELPANLPFRPSYRKANPADAPILIVSVRSDTLTTGQVYDAANTVLAQKISQVDGVGQVFVGGGQQPAVRVQVDPGSLAATGLSMDDVRQALFSQTANRPKGGLSGTVRGQSLSIGANDQLIGAKAWKNTIVRWKDNAPVMLADVAKVVDSVENLRVAGWYKAQRGVILVIRRQPGANIIEVIDRVKALLPGMAQAIHPAIDVEVTLDRSTTIRASVHDVEMSLLISIGLVFIVVLVFLRSIRATLIPSVAVPISLIGTFGIMYLCNYSLDNLSLMALTISTGFVVDDAIVVTENIVRYIELGMPPLEAALRGAKEISFTIISITASLLAVFIPILLMGGVVGRLFSEFAVTLAIAVTLSAIVSLTVTPAMCARMFRGKHEEKHGLIYRMLEVAFVGMQTGYGWALRIVLRHRIILGLITLGTMGLTVYLYIVVPKGLFPQQDAGTLMGSSDGPQDISFPAMKERTESLIPIILQEPEVVHVISFMGSGSSATANTGSFFITLRDRPPRTVSADEVISRLRPKLAQVPGIRLLMQASQDVRVGARFTRTQYQYTLQDQNLEELREFAPKMHAKLETLPELRDVATDQQTAGLQLDISVDRDTIARLGLTMRDVDAALYNAFGQRQVATTYTQLNQYRVVLEAMPRLAGDPGSLANVYLRSPTTGQPIPLSGVVKVKPSSTLLSVNHQGQFPSVTISFNTAPGKALGEAVEAIHAAEREVGLPASVQADFSGTAQAYRDSLKTMPFLIAAALLTVYIVLGMLYESYIHPITILSTLPSAGVGAIWSLMIFNLDLSIIALIGIILLIGIVKKNAIMMIDFAIEARRERGMGSVEAIYEACLLRFRPIMMTTLAALFGALPLALGTGPGSELRRPLGISIVGGLIVSQVLTLFTTPVIYLALDRFTRKKKEAVHLPAPAHAEPVPAAERSASG